MQRLAHDAGAASPQGVQQLRHDQQRTQTHTQTHLDVIEGANEVVGLRARLGRQCALVDAALVDVKVAVCERRVGPVQAVLSDGGTDVTSFAALYALKESTARRGTLTASRGLGFLGRGLASSIVACAAAGAVERVRVAEREAQGGGGGTHGEQSTIGMRCCSSSFSGTDRTPRRHHYLLLAPASVTSPQ